MDDAIFMNECYVVWSYVRLNDERVTRLLIFFIANRKALSFQSVSRNNYACMCIQLYKVNRYIQAKFVEFSKYNNNANTNYSLFKDKFII